MKLSRTSLPVNRAAFDLQPDIADYLTDFKSVLDLVPLQHVQAIITALHDAYRDQRQIFIVGNGGSAATASHLACDLGKTVLDNRSQADGKGFRVVSLADNVPLLTAWANDVGYEAIFAAQLRNLASEGDLLVAVSGSGNSPNIVQAVAAARELGVSSVGLLGFDGGIARSFLDEAVVIPSSDYGYIEGAHLVLVHLIVRALTQILL